MKHTPQAPPSVALCYYVYLLECRGGRLYAGITNDLERRLAEHAAGKEGAKFTRSFRPVKLLAMQRVADRPAALRLEAALKKLTHAEKLGWAMQHASPVGNARAAGA